MLILSRKLGTSIMIGENIRITVTKILGDKVWLGIESPREIPIHREEVFRRIKGGPGEHAT